MNRPITLSDEIRGLLPAAPEAALTAKKLFERSELAQTAEEVSKQLSAFFRRGEALRTEATPHAYWRAPIDHRIAAASAAAQPAVAQNTGSALSAPSLPEERAVPAKPGAARTAAPAGMPSDGQELRCALWNDGSLVIEAGGQRIELRREQTGLLFAYLERVAEVPGS